MASEEEVEKLFVRPGQAPQTTTVFGLAVFGLTVGTAVQTGYEKVWDLPSARWYAAIAARGVVGRTRRISLRDRHHEAVRCTRSSQAWRMH